MVARARPRERRAQGPLARDYAATLSRIALSLKALRKAKNLTQQALAERADLSTVGIAKIEGGHTNVTVATLCALARALDVDIREFFRDDAP